MAAKGTRRDWDVIVVGAGLGGLTAAARLLREGLRVLVLEAAFHPGGTAYCYRRKGYHFPMGPLGFAHPELVAGILSRAGITEPLSFRRVLYRLRAFGLSAPLSLPFGDMVAELSTLFPRETEGVARFFGDMASLSESLRTRTGAVLPPARASTWEKNAQPREVAGARGNRGVPHVGFPGGKGPAQLPDASASAARYLENITKDWRLRRILGSTGTREPYTGLGLLAATWSLLCESGIHYPQEGMRRFCDLLAALLSRKAAPAGFSQGHMSRAARARSLPWPGAPRDGSYPESDAGPSRGLLLLGSRVSRILVEKGRVRGVLTEDGASYHAPALVCNADFKEAFLRLLHAGDVPEGLVRSVCAARQTSSNLQVCLGVDADKTDLSPFREDHRIIYRRGNATVPPRDEVPDWASREIDPRDLAGGELEVALLSADDPSLAPEGKAVLVIRTSAEFPHFSAYRPIPGARAASYLPYKRRLALGLLAEVSGLLPGLESSLEVMDVATPLTFEERGGRSEGAVAGWSWDFRDHPWSEARELVRTPLEGLFMAGYQAFSMLALGGVPSAMLGGLRAAEYILAGAGPAPHMDIPIPASPRPASR